MAAVWTAGALTPSPPLPSTPPLLPPWLPPGPSLPLLLPSTTPMPPLLSTLLPSPPPPWPLPPPPSPEPTLPPPPLLPSLSAAMAPPPLLVPTSPTATPLPATTVPTPSEPSTLPRGRLRLMLRLRPIPTTDSATDTAVVMDTTVESKKPKDQHNAGAQLSPELASVSALSYLTAGYYIWQEKESKFK